LSTVDDILKLLEDGKWHDLKEIRDKTKLHDLKVENITKFLARYNFIKLDKEGQKAKLNNLTLDFLKKIRQVEEKETR
jgi:hypothetical protein